MNVVQATPSREGGGKGWIAMEPEGCIAPPEGYGKSLEEMSGGRGRVHGAGSVSNCSTAVEPKDTLTGQTESPDHKQLQDKGVDGVLSETSQCLSHQWGCTQYRPPGKLGGWRRVCAVPPLESMTPGNKSFF